MDRRALVALNKPRWVRLFPERIADDLEVEIVPGKMPDMTLAQVLGKTPEAIKQDVCTNSFTNFRGYVEDGKSVDNTLPNRLEFYGFPPCRHWIDQRLQEANAEVVEGEESAVSD